MGGFRARRRVSKFASFAEYPPRSLVGAEAALLTAWASLDRFQDDLVLVGGLAVKYLTKPAVGLLPGPVTMDVDFGVALAAEAGGQYGSLADDLAGQGFKRDENGRYVRQFEGIQVFIDFLTEHPTATSGTVGVDGVAAAVFPGVARALATRRDVTVIGKDVFGAFQRATVPVCGIGALLVLKLNAFAGRQQAKHAYDVLLGVSRFVEGPHVAIAAFQAEAAARNRGYGTALQALRRHFYQADHSGPLRAAAFALEGQTGIDDRNMRERQIVEQLVTIGRALAGGE
jgi:hypothetical protein